MSTEKKYTKEEIIEIFNNKFDLNNIPNVDEQKKKFLTNQKLFLTYKGHIDKTKLKQLFLSKYENLKFWRSSHEISDFNHSYDHTHVLVDFGFAIQSSNRKIFDWIDENKIEYHPEIKIVKNITLWKYCEKILATQDKENDDLRKIYEIKDYIRCCGCVDDAIKKYSIDNSVENLSSEIKNKLDISK